MKGGLKSMIDASFHVGSGIANRAGAMYESIKMGLTTNLFMRGLGLSRQQIYEDAHPPEETVQEEEEEPEKPKMTRIRSNSDPAAAFSYYYNNKSMKDAKSTIRKSPPVPLPTSNTPYSLGAQKLKALNVTGRVDYCLQEGLLENPYLSAFSAHLQYWQVIKIQL